MFQIIRMSDWTGRYCVINNNVVETKHLQNIKLPSQVFYEVIRIIDDVFLFLEEHLERLNFSVKNYYKDITIDFKEIRNILLNLKFNNSLSAGNVKILLFYNARDNSIQTVAYQIAHYYPSKEQYLNGVKVALYYSEREKPNIKYINNLLQDNCQNEISSKHVFEVLLVDHNYYITEGSKSNVFFIKNNHLITPPSHRVLKGITRQHLFDICNKLNYKIFENNISTKDLNIYTSVFITGTSPKILPVNSINQYRYDVQNIILQRIMEEYNLQIIEYITKIKHSGYSL